MSLIGVIDSRMPPTVMPRSSLKMFVSQEKTWSLVKDEDLRSFRVVWDPDEFIIGKNLLSFF